ncbi:MAG: hypothetical protein ACLRT5_09330 [Lachnospiraceae bacterium]
MGTAVHSWFGQVWNQELYQGLDATAFLETDFREDAAAIRWLNDHVWRASRWCWRPTGTATAITSGCRP